MLLTEVYDDDFDMDVITIDDAFIIARTLLNLDMPVPVDLIDKLHNSGVYIAH